jgi:signal peptidase II
MTLTKYLYGPLTGFGIVVALVAGAIDQAVKLWLIYGLDLGARGTVRLGPFIDLVLVWNTGISYGLFPQVGAFGQWALLGVKAVAVVLLWVWLAHATSRLTALALGLIIGGAIGNVIDRLRFGGVIDFLYFHLGAWYWPAFNLADSAICLGVAAMLLDGLLLRRAAPPAKGGEDLRP